MLPVATVSIDGTVAEVLALPDDGRPVAVLGEGDVLLGAVQPTVRQLAATTPLERIMITAPGTVRPDKRVEEVLDQLSKDGLDHVFVTTVSGILLGLVVPGEIHV
ncbi:MAG: hypothetical protein JWN62_2007 [Acidimicrobiales bacterium]|nr:hypothetical protein [Acidimicrobiales bacterium]